MDINSEMVLVRGKDKTKEVSKIELDSQNRKVMLTYQKGERSYTYNKSNVDFLRNPKEINLNGRVAYIDDMPVYKPKCILDFKKRIRIIQYDSKDITVNPSSFSLVKNGGASIASKQILSYLKEISQYTSSDPKEEAFLKREMERLIFIHPESVLYCFLNRQLIKQRTVNRNEIIFPFSFNLSQKAALENALENSISVIQGPPGTGKTQTILNILANLVAIQGKSVAVVSNNNEAVKNVIEKMEKQGYGFLNAFLGKQDNQIKFFDNMPVAQVDQWDCEEDKSELFEILEDLNIKLNQMLEADRTRAQLDQELRAWQLEQEHFEEYYKKQDVEEISRLPLFKKTPDKIILFLAETSFALKQKRTNKIMYRLKLFIKYGVLNYKTLQDQELSILLSLQREFYSQQISKLEDKIAKLKKKLDREDFETLRKMHQQYSEKLFRKCLYQSYSELSQPNFTKKNYKAKFQEFIKTFPIILSTTYALRQSIPQDYLLDYVIIDEASQVDLITGILAFSCCKNVIIVGDVKQLPQIVDETIKPLLKTSPSSSQYDYFTHNILSSVISLYGDDLPCETLREHYRCHPQIIEFCNQKYYNGKLICYTSTEFSEYPLVLYKTVEGNHMREVTKGNAKGKYNQRELDVVVEEILKDSIIEEQYNNIGFVTPYRKQANKAGEILHSGIESDTVHKYQGREKDIIIMSTVLDSTQNGYRGLRFVDDSQMVNVAVSRAVKQFVLVTDHKFFLKQGNNISDLIRYIQYSTLDENVIESKIVSVFDLLYRQYSSKLNLLKEKMNKNPRYKSEEALRVLLDEILAKEQYNHYCYMQEVLLRNLLSTVELLTPEELKFVNNRASLDFVIFYKQDKACALVIEVDGFAFHENEPEQLRRDQLKDSILRKYGVPILRLATNGSREQEKIQNALD